MLLQTQTSTVIKKCLLIIALSLPVITFAAPSPIETIEIEYDAGDVIISWEAPPELNIAYYNVYYSGESILENQGAYDDFESTEGPTSFYTFTDLVEGKKYYFSVLAVDDANEESAGFVKEVSITMPVQTTLPDDVFQLPTKQEFAPVSSASSSNISSVQSSVSSVEQSTVKLLSAVATKPNEVQLVFSGLIDVNEESAARAFAIVTAQGQKLPIANLKIDNQDVRLTTAMQSKGVVYEVQLDDPIKGYPNGEPLDQTARRAFFTGHPDATGTPPSGSSASSSSVSSSNSSSQEFSEEVQNVQVSTIPEGNNSHTIILEWNVPNPRNGLSNYLVSQSFDGGYTFTDPEILPPGIGGVELTGIQASLYGVKVNTVDTRGTVSPGVYQPIQIGSAPIYTPPPPAQSSSSSSVQIVQPPVGNVIQPPITGKGGSLPQSGGTFVLITMGAAGMIAGSDRVRKKFARRS